MTEETAEFDRLIKMQSRLLNFRLDVKPIDIFSKKSFLFDKCAFYFTRLFLWETHVHEHSKIISCCIWCSCILHDKIVYFNFDSWITNIKSNKWFRLSFFTIELNVIVVVIIIMIQLRFYWLAKIEMTIIDIKKMSSVGNDISLSERDFVW